ncbi:MAG TPA: glucokinase [Blastocatellia bacterium]|nr:glucokinase [Blastocatellia bacterium]
MILAGDIGGTKTNLGLFDVAGGALRPRNQQSFPSKRYEGLESIVDEFLSAADRPSVDAACFGIAGPVLDDRSVTPNLPWVVKSESLASQLKLDSVALINDLEATAHGIAELKPDEFATLNQGDPDVGNAALIAAGTGMGSASLFWDGHRHIPSASEGGHIDFAPRDQLETRLLQYLLEKYGHVSVERVVSGPGLLNIYDFLRSTGYAKEDPIVVQRFAQSDPSSVVANAALANECQLCTKALDVFVGVYGAVAGNVALLLKATAGVYIGGGIAPKIVEKLKDGTFMKAFTAKGRLASLLEAIPVRVIMNDKTALLGAARVAGRQSANRSSV